MPIKVIFFGSQASGKTELIKKLKNPESKFESKYKRTIGADFLPIGEIKSKSIHTWDIAGDERFRALRLSYLRNANILCYCVDLSKDIDHAQIEKDIKEGLAYSPPEAKLIIIGTKADLCMSSGENPEDKLNSLQLNDVPHERIVTSALDKTGLVNTESKEKTTLYGLIHKSFENILEESNPKLTQPRPHGIVQPTSQDFPSSYTRMWSQGSSNPRDAALILLRDYSKLSSQPGFFENLQSSAKLFACGHWFRNNHKAVSETLKKSYNSPQDLLTALRNNLIEQGNPINASGSLARRINFIQEQIKESVINIDDINRQIQKNNSEKLTPKF
ncbi:ADP-ribosylation factor-like protein [Legionella hackeliae]|uniref:RavJ-like C-terminal domain-containing protein n=1 Tax=Legionella hackeliae TaxID=449 RepID=A0A0A8USJ7_LEGHA|nr:ADP-ribosylation factor-like protein [Legionella hackeliae]KTD10004.1 Rho GTPase (Miro-like) [Legionella hackeliae]CEK11693.1 protein of unknown function [Legionella hackeliae]STX48462.1 Rho GTPase (Miro-like) [Legionella hackeliae]